MSSNPSGEMKRSWAGDVLIALLNCLCIASPSPSLTISSSVAAAGVGNADAPSATINSSSTSSDGGEDDDTVLARAALSVFALLLEKNCTACFNQLVLCYAVDDTSGNNSGKKHGGGDNDNGSNGAGASSGNGSGGGDGGGDDGANRKNNNNNTRQYRPASPGERRRSEQTLVSLPVKLLLLAEEAIKYQGEAQEVTILRATSWPEGRSRATRDAQAAWQRRVRLAQEALTLLRGLILLADTSIAVLSMDELLVTPATTQRMLTALSRLSRVEPPPFPTEHCAQLLFPPLPVAPWAYSIGSSSNASSLGGVMAVERRAGLPCCSAGDVTYIASGIKNRVLYRLRG